MDELSIKVIDMLRWIIIGQGTASAIIFTILVLWFIQHFARRKAWRRFTCLLVFLPSYLSKFAFMALEMHQRLGRPPTYRTWLALFSFTFADFAFLILLGHLMVRSQTVKDGIEWWIKDHNT